MKKLMMAVVVAACAAEAFAMPTKDELTKAQPLVAELMAPAMAKYKAAGYKEKAAAAAKVGDASSEFAKAAETEAAKFLLLKGAVNFYTRGEQYDKAADMIAELQREVKDVPPAVIAEITGKATGKISESKAPKLYAIYRSAKLQVRAADEAKALAAKLKKAKSDALLRKYAEALAVSGDWNAAYAEFAKVSDAKLKEIAAAEAAGNAKNAESGEFWWAYQPAFEDAEDFFKSHAAAYYRKALDAGEITGLKKSIVEQRVAGVVAEATPVVLQGTVANAKSAASPGAGKAWQEKGNTAWLDLGDRGKLEFVKCPAGSVNMLTGRSGETARIKISRPFWIMKDPFRGYQMAVAPGVPAWLRDSKDVVHGSRKHDEAASKWMTSEFGNDIPKGYVVRLPSLAEFEYAFHANTTNCKDPYYDLTKGHFNDDVGKARKTTPNAWGIRDFSTQRCLDTFVPSMFVDDAHGRKGVGISEIVAKPDPVDNLFWSEDADRLNVMRSTEYGIWRMCKQDQRESDFGPITRLVVGPDLVSEWKAKHGKK